MLDFVNKPLTLQGEVKFKIVSLFSGAGGSSLGYIWAGGKVLAAVEWDENAVATYRLNFPDTPILHRDIKTVTVEELLALTHLVPGELDILDGSPPCQGFSTAGKRQIDDPRNSLFQEYVRLLRGLQPKCFVMENVSGMVKGNMKHVFAIAMRELKASGYRVKCQLMNAMYFGVPQSRQRVIFIGVRNDLEIEVSYPTGQTQPIIVKEAWEGVANHHGPDLKGLSLHIACHMPPGTNNGGGKFSKVHIGRIVRFNLARLSYQKVSPTIAKSSGDLLLPDRNYFLSISQIKRLASFPDAFQLIGSFDVQWARIGNSVPPMFMYHLASHVYTHILQRTSEVSHA